MPTRRQFLVGGAATCLGIATPLAWYGGIYEPGDIEVTRRSIAVRNLPARLDGTTAVQISDLHLHAGDDTHGPMVRLITQERPDYVFFTGDLLNEAAAVGLAEDIFRSVAPPGGSWAVVGNSDLSARAVHTMRTRLAGTVRYLVDEAAQLESGLWIAGVNESASYLSDVPAAISSVPIDASRILLAHSPDIADQMEGARFDLVLAGHTHGGQIRLPFFDGAWLHQGLSGRYVEGLYAIGDSPLYVNRGIGTSRVPLRIRSRPEITHFTLLAA